MRNDFLHLPAVITAIAIFLSFLSTRSYAAKEEERGPNYLISLKVNFQDAATVPQLAG